MMTVFDHIDLRVSDVARVRGFYDAFLRAFGFRGRPQDDGTMLYFRLEDRRVCEAIAVIPAKDHPSERDAPRVRRTDPGGRRPHRRDRA
jgi:hypothetical protein